MGTSDHHFRIFWSATIEDSHLCILYLVGIEHNASMRISNVSFKSAFTALLVADFHVMPMGLWIVSFHVLFSAFFYDSYASMIILYWWLRSIIYF